MALPKSNNNGSPVDGIIFDLDGTLVASALDFELMRAEMRLPSGVPLLETIAELPPEDRLRCHEILHRHELAGAARAELMPGVGMFLDSLAERGLRRAVVTRNSRILTIPLLARLGLDFDPVLTRDDGPVKPDPASIQHICRIWQTGAARVVMLGDYRFDLELGRRAGAKSVLYLGGRSRDRLPDWASEADFVLASFLEPAAFFDWLDRQTA
ncbi:MAG TPA: HAD family hydrolase [Pirellulales bacterium]|nr:HAD family hydrolase [Pirellulales bacterium]